MQNTPVTIQILWDASPLWGHLVLNAVIQTGFSYEIITAKQCQEQAPNAKILLVPGGSGNFKSQLLGEVGMQNIRDFVSQGGVYIGFCGGAGLALAEGLALCPWGRHLYGDRSQHLVSGHTKAFVSLPENIFTPHHQFPILSQEQNNCLMALPVWWPGRFEDRKAEENQQGVHVSARYQDIGNDLHLSDIPLNFLPKTSFEDWQNMYGVSLRPELLDNQPTILMGDYGQGHYVLSYSHLETPNSPDANRLFAQILAKYLDIEPNSRHCSDKWIYENNRSQENHNLSPYFEINWQEAGSSNWLILQELYTHYQEFFDFAVNLHHLFPRNAWLYGWASHIPGSNLNALRVALMRAVALPVTPVRTRYMQENITKFAEAMMMFMYGAKSWLLAQRLNTSFNEKSILPSKIIKQQRIELFGNHMYGGGVCGDLLKWLDDFLLIRD